MDILMKMLSAYASLSWLKRGPESTVSLPKRERWECMIIIIFRELSWTMMNTTFLFLYYDTIIILSIATK